MNITDNAQLLEFIKTQYNTYSNLRVFEDNHYLKGIMFYIDKVGNNYILMHEEDNNIQFSFYNVDEKDPYARFNMPMEECRKFLEFIYQQYEANLIEKLLYNNPKYADQISKAIHNIKTQLLGYDNPETNAYYACQLLIEHDVDLKHKLSVGQLVNLGGRKTKINKASIIEVPVEFYFEKSQPIKTKITFPCWEIDDYPYIKRFLDIPKCANNLKDLKSVLEDKLPQAGKDLFYCMLSHTIEDKDKNNKNKNKL